VALPRQDYGRSLVNLMALGSLPTEMMGARGDCFGNRHNSRRQGAMQVQLPWSVPAKGFADAATNQGSTEIGQIGTCFSRLAIEKDDEDKRGVPSQNCQTATKKGPTTQEYLAKPDAISVTPHCQT
jgi:hypothetical protein